jgi:hypothetical protein
MRTVTGLALAALAGAELEIAQLLYMQFPSVVVALNSSNYDIDYGGVTYRGAAGLGTIAEIEDSPGEIKGIQLQMSGIPTEYLTLALSDATVVQGAILVIRLAIIDQAGTVLDAPLDWIGTVDTMPIEEDGETCAISITAESSAVDFLRGNALTTSDPDQRFLYPGDLAFQYVVPQAEVQIVWPTKQYYIDSR